MMISKMKSFLSRMTIYQPLIIVMLWLKCRKILVMDLGLQVETL